MRRTIPSAIAIAAAVVGVACEDGPDQAFQPASPNAGNLWNNGDAPAAVNDVDASLTAGYGGAGSSTQICSGAELQLQWNRMVRQPVVPPFEVAAFNMVGWTPSSADPVVNYNGVTVEQLETGIAGALFPAPGAVDPPTRLCQGLVIPGPGPDTSYVLGGTYQTAFGQNNQIVVEWSANTHQVYAVFINPGYVGTTTWTYRQPPKPTDGLPHNCITYGGCDGQLHTYVWQLLQPVTDNGQSYEFDWVTGGAKLDQQVDVIYRGLTQTFAPQLFDGVSATNPKGLSPDVTCAQTGRCVSYGAGSGAFPEIGIRTLSLYWGMGAWALPQPSGSIVDYGWIYNQKFAPYSGASITLDMSTSAGPAGLVAPIGDEGKTCALGLGGTFGAVGSPNTLLNDCVDVFQSADAGATALEEVLGSRTHDDQNYTFSVVGVNQNYRDPELDLGGTRQFDVVHDDEPIPPGATAADFTYDYNAFGAVQNDYYATSTAGISAEDDHGTGAVWREFGRMVQADLSTRLHAANPGLPLRDPHDPACLFTAAQANPDGGVFDPTTWRAPAGCTGFEGFVDEAYPNVWANTRNGHVAGQPVDPSNPTRIDPDNVWDVAYGLGSISGGGLRPGTPAAFFCMDPGAYYFCGSPSLYGSANGILDASLQMVVNVMGNGNVNNLPPGVGDRRYFLKFFTEALSKYFVSGMAKHTGPCGLAGAPADTSLPSTLGLGCGASAATAAAFDPVPYFGDTPLNTDDMFFDSLGPNNAQGEFVNYQFAGFGSGSPGSSTHYVDPLGFNLQMILIGSNVTIEHFYRRLDREERALFESMENEDAKLANQAAWGLDRNASGAIVNEQWPAKGGGAPVSWPRKNANVFLTNMAGSAAISGGPWVAATDAHGNPIVVQGSKNTPPGTVAFDPCFPNTPPGQVTKTAWYCATHLDPDCPFQAPTSDDAGKVLITRENGEPLLAGYCGIWNPTALALGSTEVQVVRTHLNAVTSQLENEVEVLVPSYANPYNLPGSSNPYGEVAKALTPIDVLVPWVPANSGVGFSIPNSVAGAGQTNVFVPSAELDFSGQIIVPVLNYAPTAAQDGGVSSNIQVLAWQSGDFLGQVFLCYDTVSQANRVGTGRPGDILAVGMYTSVQEIIAWIDSHPQAQSSCGLVIQYAPFDNYPNVIASLNNDVLVDIDHGQGFGRVVDATLWLGGVGAGASP